MSVFDIFKGFRRELCPYCFEKFWLHRTPFRCSNPISTKSKCKAMDPIMHEKWGDKRPQGKVLPAKKRFVRSQICPECDHKSRTRICPHCHAPLPYTTGDYRNHIFAVIGAKNAGKSNYIAVLIDQITRRLEGALNILLEPVNEETAKRYRDEFYKPLFEDGSVIDKTPSATTDYKTRQPLIFCLTVTKAWLQWLLNRSGPLNALGNTRLLRHAGTRVAVLVFFDAAGENLDSDDVASVVNRYIYRSKGIILLVDPLQLPQVRSQLSDEARLNLPKKEKSDGSDVANTTTRLIRKGLELGASDAIQIPMAVAFSKFDAVQSLMNTQCQLNRSPRHIGGFDVVDFEAVHGEMLSLLDGWGGEHLVEQIKRPYARYGFFGLSALGCAPDPSGRVPRVQPKRVVDPFLWLLWQNGLIRKAKKTGKVGE